MWLRMMMMVRPGVGVRVIRIGRVGYEREVSGLRGISDGIWGSMALARRNGYEHEARILSACVLIGACCHGFLYLFRAILVSFHYAFLVDVCG